MLYPGLVHVRDVGLKQASDPSIWEYAKQNGHTIVTADADFVAYAQRMGPPPKVVHVQQCTFPFAIIEEMLRRNAVRIAEFEKDWHAGLLLIRR